MLVKPHLEDEAGKRLEIGDAAARSGDDGAWRTGRQKFFPGLPLQSWALVSLTGRCDEHMLHKLADELKNKGAREHGMIIEPPRVIRRGVYVRDRSSAFILTSGSKTSGLLNSFLHKLCLHT